MNEIRSREGFPIWATVTEEMSLQQLLDQRLITWHRVKLNERNRSEHSYTIAFTVQYLSGNTAMHYG